MGELNKPEIGKELMTYAEAAKHLAETVLPEKAWSGLPVPVVGLDLVLEPRYRHKSIAEFKWKECYDEDGIRHDLTQPEPSEPSEELSFVNSWWNSRLQLKIYIFKNKQGRAQIRFKVEDRLSITLRTLEAAAVWPMEAEQRAQKKLARMIPEHLFEQYMLTGHFPEVSKRSNVTYIFRRGRPTIALRENEEMFVVLCALCLHPIGYYGDTWAGVMCPTDEVIAHLLMMRGSEEKFWANANQHSIDHPAAGV